MSARVYTYARKAKFPVQCCSENYRKPCYDWMEGWNKHMERSVEQENRMREKDIEKELAARTRAMGGIAPKFTSPGFDGMPDRLVLLPGGRMGFVELKAPGKKPRALQLARHRLLQRLGFKVYVIDGIEQIDGVLEEIDHE